MKDMNMFDSDIVQYYLMNKNKPVLLFAMDKEDGRINRLIDIIDISIAPIGSLYLGKSITKKSFADWWDDRAIPASRSGLRNFLDTMDIRSRNLLTVKCSGLSLIDQYWVKEKNSNITWEQINFFDNNFSEDMGEMLFGNFNNNLNLVSPNNTSDGWLKKKWKIVNNDRVLFKAGSGTEMQEPLNEAIISIINSRTGFKNYIGYELAWENNIPFSTCKNFITRDTELVTAHQLINLYKRSNNVSPYKHYLDCCDNVGIAKRETIEFMKYMFTLDYLILNQDRHYNNFGLIRNVNTMEIIGHAPVFDNGTSLWNGIATPFIGSNSYQEAKPFRSTHYEQIDLIGRSEWFSKDKLYGIADEFNDLLLQSIYISEDRRNKLVKSLDNRINNYLTI